MNNCEELRVARIFLLTGLIALVGCSQAETAGRPDESQTKDTVKANCASSIDTVKPRLGGIADQGKRHDAQAALARANKYLAAKDEVGCLHEIELVLQDLGQDVLVRPKH